MAPDDDQEIMARISQLAGQINRHKNRRSPAQPPFAHQSSDLSTPQSAGHAPWRRAGPLTRGNRVQKLHRHKSLVLNGASLRTVPSPGPPTGCSNSQDSPGLSWISKTDRHLQLINSAVFEQEKHNRSAAVHDKQRTSSEGALEHARLLHFSSRANNLDQPTGASANGNPQKHVLMIEDIPFFVAKGGRKLVRLPSDTEDPAKTTPNVADIGGVKFYRTKNGNLYRQGIVKAHRELGPVMKIAEPCAAFSTTGTPLLSAPMDPPSARSSASGFPWYVFEDAPLIRFNCTPGSCLNGPLCRYEHNPDKVSVCKDLLQRGQCPRGDACDLSHSLTQQRVPSCLHYSKGNCTNPNCRYVHNNVALDANVCRLFGRYGFCPAGADCTERHVNECPDFSNTGVCKAKKCRLPHRDRASFLRRTQNPGDASSGVVPEGDVSSDDDKPGGNEEVDFDEFLGPDDSFDVDAELRKDTIMF